MLARPATGDVGGALLLGVQQNVIEELGGVPIQMLAMTLEMACLQKHHVPLLSQAQVGTFPIKG